MINFSTSKFRFLAGLILFLLTGESCTSDKVKVIELNFQQKFNSYELFEEPTTENIKKFQFYFLAATWGGFENTQILSIRKNEDNNSYGYYKVVDRNLMPPISNTIKTDTFSFDYSTTYFKLENADIDTLQKLIQEYSISQLKDTVLRKDLDSKTTELILFQKDSFFNVFRSGSKGSIEKNYAAFLDIVMKKFIPLKPIPFFQR